MAKKGKHMAKQPNSASGQLQGDQDYISCGNCGQVVGKKQTYTQIYNSRFHNYEYYHETYTGCYEATQKRNSRPRIILNRLRPGINDILSGNDSYADLMDERSVTE